MYLPVILAVGFRLALAALAFGLAGCTIERMQHDTTTALEWVRLAPAAEPVTTTRWQLPRSASILIVEAVPAPDPAWLTAAQEGVDSVFPAPALAGPLFHLLVSWPVPDDERARSRRVSLWEIIDMDQFLPDFQPRFALQVALVRSADGALLQAAELRVTPRWLSGRSAGPALVRQAFRELVSGFRPAS